jgi:hypothetical protein
MEFAREDIRLDHREAGALAGEQRRASRRVANDSHSPGAPMPQMNLAHGSK